MNSAIIFIQLINITNLVTLNLLNK